MEFQIHDLIRSHDFVRHGRPDEPVCYLEGVVVGFDGEFIDFVITKRVWGDKSERVGTDKSPWEFSRTPKLGVSIFDDASLPRLERIKPAPKCFALDEECAKAYEAFRAEMHGAELPTSFQRTKVKQ